MRMLVLPPRNHLPRLAVPRTHRLLLGAFQEVRRLGLLLQALQAMLPRLLHRVLIRRLCQWCLLRLSLRLVLLRPLCKQRHPLLLLLQMSRCLCGNEWRWRLRSMSTYEASETRERDYRVVWNMGAPISTLELLPCHFCLRASVYTTPLSRYMHAN